MTETVRNHRFVVPTIGLRVQEEMKIGDVVFLPAPKGQLPDVIWPVGRQQLVDHEWALAMIAAADQGSALRQVARVLDALRVFTKATVEAGSVPDFGTPGSISSEYVSVGCITARYTMTSTQHVGLELGFDFTPDLLRHWHESVWGTFVEPALISTTSKSSVRAVRGIELLSRAWIEPQPELCLFLSVAALEAWLTSGDSGSTTYNFIRRSIPFTCHCNVLGEAGPPSGCEAIAPVTDGKLQKSWRDDDTRPCREWHRLLDVYNSRSAVVHGDPVELRSESVRRFLLRVTRHSLPRALTWLSQHPEDVIEKWDERLNGIAASIPNK